VPGIALALFGAILTWLGFAFLLNWRGQSLIAGIVVMSVGLTCIGLAGNLQRPRIAAAYGLSAAATLLAALLIGTQVPNMVAPATDTIMLWVAMGSGTLVFFGLSMVIAAAMAKAMAKD